MNARISCTCSHRVRDGKIYTSAMVCDNTSYCGRLNPTNSGELAFEALFVFIFYFVHAHVTAEACTGFITPQSGVIFL